MNRRLLCKFFAENTFQYSNFKFRGTSASINYTFVLSFVKDIFGMNVLYLHI